MATSNSDALLGGGYNAPGGTNVANTESWNGSSWTELADITTARSHGGSGGGSASGVLMAGYLASPNAGTAATEEWDNAGATKTLTVS